MSTETSAEAPTDELVSRSLEEGVLVLAWNRPHRANAWTPAMGRRYFELLDEAADDPEVRAIVLTGTGRTFCPGMDSSALDTIAENPQDNTALLAQRPESHPTTIPKPIVAAINGACAGIGLIQALNCDVRFAARGAKLATSFAQRGIMAENGVAWLVSRLAGTGVAMDLLLSGRVVLAEEAHELGLVNRVVEPDEVLPAAVEYARSLARRCSPIAMAAIKQQVYHASTATLEQSRQTAVDLWMDVLKPHTDFREGVDALLERREPRFRGLTRGDVGFALNDPKGTP